MIYLTGDTHGRFERIGAFCDKMQTDRDDILIILGDAGINFHADARDNLRKEYLARLPITLFCIHGNHERRPESLDVYDEREWHGGQVFTEDRYPNGGILFMLTKETFIQAITAIRKHEELMDRLDAVCREFGDFRPCLDFGNLHLQALLAVLKEAMNDQDDYISWWLYDGGDRIVSWEENGQTVSVDLTDVNALYCFLAEQSVE